MTCGALPGHLAAAYRRTEYRVAGLSLRIGRRNRALARLLTGEAFLITAANPGSRVLLVAWNARRQAALAAALGQALIMTGESGTGRWLEPQILTNAPAARVAVLGRRFGQMAVVRLRPGQAPALVPLRTRPCDRPSPAKTCSMPC